MSVQDFVDYLKANLARPADKAKCLCFLDSLSPYLSENDQRYAAGMLDRWISVGVFNGSISRGYREMHCDHSSSSSAKRSATEADEELSSSAKRPRGI